MSDGHKATELSIKIFLTLIIALCGIRSLTIDNIVECRLADKIKNFPELAEDADITYPGLAKFYQLLG